jgi:GTP-binding protein
VGLPNAGKSTFLSVVSAAKPKIADYPFTTLKPQLGVVRIGYEEFVIADLPGLIEGASEGCGLGDKFLKHVERCRIILHLIDASSEDCCTSYDIVHKELFSYSENLTNKTEVIALSKIDVLDIKTINKKIHALEKHTKCEVMTCSSIQYKGIKGILDRLYTILKGSISNSV